MIPFYLLKKNVPIATQIKNYQNKASGKVSEARKDIQQRFSCLDWKIQKQILFLFLDSGKTDRIWAYTKLFWIWEDSFCEKIQSLWEQYHEDRCSWVIIKHFPEQYLQEHIDSLGYGRNYYFICRRLCLLKDYEVDKSKLTKLDYLSILALKHEQIEDNKVLDTMFAIVHDLCVGGVSWQEGRTLSHGSIYSATSSSQISRALDYLYEMGCHSAAGIFRSWDDNVKQSIFESQEYIEINHTPMNDSTYQHKIVGLGLLYMYEALEDKYKSKDDPSADQIKNPFPYYYVIGTNENPDELPF